MDKVNVAKQYKFNKYHTNLTFNIYQKYQSRINNHFTYQKYKAKDLLGCSILFFIKWLNYRKKTIPSSKNISLFSLTIDHVIPLNSFSDGDVYLAFNWRNCIPVTKEYNLTKKDLRINELEREQIEIIEKYMQK